MSTYPWEFFSKSFIYSIPNLKNCHRESAVCRKHVILNLSKKHSKEKFFYGLQFFNFIPARNSGVQPLW